MFAAGGCLRAQEFSLLAGRMFTPDLTAHNSSYAWQIDYRHGIYRNLEASIAWINEGHVRGHHRDGNAFELWYRLPLFSNILRLSAGVGPYYFYDTQPLPGSDNGSLDVHGVAPIFSLSAAGVLRGRWFWRVMLNRINPTTDIQTNTILAGMGVWLGAQPSLPQKNLPNLLHWAENRVGGNRRELTVFGGWSVVNTLLSQHALAGAVEYRWSVAPTIDATVSYLYEGNPHIIRRSGVALQLWPLTKSFGDRFELGIGVGAYVYIDRRQPLPTGQKSSAAVAGIVSPTMSYRFGHGWFLRVIWDRVISDYNRDADVWLVGLGHRL